MNAAVLTGRALFASAAPRLELAHRERCTEIVRLHAERRAWLDIRHEREWCVAHRELQLLRAYAKGDRRYMKKREKLLAKAQRDLQAADTALAEIRRSLP